MSTQKIYSAKEAEERFEKLPLEIKTFIYSPEMFATLKSVADKHHLHIDQLALLQAEVSSVMLGFTESQDFVPTLEENIKLEAEEAKTIAADINEAIFLKIRESMKDLPKNQPLTPLAPVSTPPPAPAPVATVQKPAELHPADMMLSQKTVTTSPPVPPTPPAPSAAPVVVQVSPPAAKPEPPKPEPYKADPYREIPE